MRIHPENCGVSGGEVLEEWNVEPICCPGRAFRRFLLPNHKGSSASGDCMRILESWTRGGWRRLAIPQYSHDQREKLAIASSDSDEALKPDILLKLLISPSEALRMHQAYASNSGLPSCVSKARSDDPPAPRRAIERITSLMAKGGQMSLYIEVQQNAFHFDLAWR